MANVDIPTLNVLVAGDPGSGKSNFIKKFLYYFPSSAEVRRNNDMVYCLFKQDKCLKIQLNDVGSISTIERHIYDNMDAVFFCYAANDPESLQRLEKWIRLMPIAKNEMHSYLVADMSNLGNRHDVVERLSEKASNLAEIFGVKRFIESHFDDEESASIAFQIILKEISQPKLVEKLPFTKFNEYPEKFPRICLRKMPHFSEPCLEKMKPPILSKINDGDIENAFFCKNLQVYLSEICSIVY